MSDSRQRSEQSRTQDREREGEQPRDDLTPAQRFGDVHRGRRGTALVECVNAGLAEPDAEAERECRHGPAGVGGGCAPGFIRQAPQRPSSIAADQRQGERRQACREQTQLRRWRMGRT